MPTDWTITFGNLTIGGPNSPYQLVQINGLHDAPEVRTSDQIRARSNGMFAGTDYLGGRSVIAEVQVVASHPDETVWQDFSSALIVGAESETALGFQIPGLARGNAVQIDARVRKLSLPIERSYLNGQGNAVIEWFATDPRVYTQSVDTETASQATVAGTGVTFPVTFPLSFGGAVSGGQLQATNIGEFGAPWSATISGPIVNPTLENITTGETLAFIGSVAAGETLVINSLDRSVLLNGTASRYSWLVVGSQWFTVEPGDNAIRLAGTSGTGSVSFSFRSAWI
jgi:hypothetical protein